MSARTTREAISEVFRAGAQKAVRDGSAEDLLYAYAYCFSGSVLALDRRVTSQTHDAVHREIRLLVNRDTEQALTEAVRGLA